MQRVTVVLDDPMSQHNVYAQILQDKQTNYTIIEMTYENWHSCAKDAWECCNRHTKYVVFNGVKPNEVKGLVLDLYGLHPVRIERAYGEVEIMTPTFILICYNPNIKKKVQAWGRSIEERIHWHGTMDGLPFYKDGPVLTDDDLPF